MFRLKNVFFFRGFEYMITPKLKERLRSLVSLTAGGSVAFLGFGLWSNNQTFYNGMVMPLVHRLDPETAHRAAVWAAAHGLVPHDRSTDHSVLRTSLWGLRFSNPVGLAAGFDKDAEACDGMLSAGFGLVEVGSVTPRPQPGNPRPRLFRLPEDEAVINRYGFNSGGHAAVLERLRARGAAARVGVNLGKNRDSTDAAADYVAGVRAFADTAAYFVVNVSSPNTPGLRDLQTGEDLPLLLDAVLDARDRHCAPPRPPLLLKISPDLTPHQRRHVAHCVVARRDRLGGLVVGNTTTTRPGLRSEHAVERGGLSGRPLTAPATAVVADMYRLTEGLVPIVGVGGVFSGRDAYDKIRAGASLVQLYTALALRGPPVVSVIKRELSELLLWSDPPSSTDRENVSLSGSADGFTSVSEAVGADHRTETDQPALARAVS